MSNAKSITILLVEDNPADVDLVREAFADAKISNHLYVCEDGIDTLDFLYQRNGYEDAPQPDLVMLDLNLPRMGGIEVMQEIAKDENLRTIPIVVMTTSDNEEDIQRSYQNFANCYVKKPLDFAQFFSVVQMIENFWLTVVKLPTNLK